MDTMAGVIRTGVVGAALTLTLNLHPSALSAQGGPTEIRGVQMGMAVRIVGHGPPDAVRDAGARVLARMDSLEWILSDWRGESEVSRLGRQPAGRWVEVSPVLFEVLALAREVAAATDGAFDPTVGPLTALWRQARETGQPIADAHLAAARQRVGWRLLSLDSARSAIRLARDGMRLDLGGIAKGWILGDARALMRRAGVASVLIEAGGDIVVGAPPPGQPGWRIALRTARGDSVVTLADAAIATSGPGAQWMDDPGGVRRSHVINPASGRGSDDPVEVTVIGDDPARTDALATALTLIEPERRAKLARRFGVVMVTRNDRR